MTSPSSAESAPTTPKSETPEAGPLQTLRDRLFRGELGQLPVVLTLVLIAIFFEITSHGIFFSPQNLSNLILQIATIGFLGLGSVLVLLIAEIDLSLAAVASLCGAVLVVLSAGHSSSPGVAIIIAIVAGVVIGLVNGFFVAVLRVPSFIVTLAALIGYTGLLIHLLPNASIRLIDPFLTGIATNYLTFPWDVLLPVPLIALYVLLQLWTRVRRQARGAAALSALGTGRARRRGRRGLGAGAGYLRELSRYSLLRADSCRGAADILAHHALYGLWPPCLRGRRQCRGGAARGYWRGWHSGCHLHTSLRACGDWWHPGRVTRYFSLGADQSYLAARRDCRSGDRRRQPLRWTRFSLGGCAWLAHHRQPGKRPRPAEPGNGCQADG